MFAARYFAPRYYAPRYWTPGYVGVVLSRIYDGVSARLKILVPTVTLES